MSETTRSVPRRFGRTFHDESEDLLWRANRMESPSKATSNFVREKIPKNAREKEMINVIKILMEKHRMRASGKRRGEFSSAFVSGRRRQKPGKKKMRGRETEKMHMFCRFKSILAFFQF